MSKGRGRVYEARNTNDETRVTGVVMSGLGGLNKSPNGVVIGLVCFLGLTALLFLSFLTGGRFDIHNFYTRLALLVVSCFLIPLVVGYAWVWNQAADRSAQNTQSTQNTQNTTDTTAAAGPLPRPRRRIGTGR